MSDAIVDRRGALILALPVFTWPVGETPSLIAGRYLIVKSPDGADTFGEPVEAGRMEAFGHANETMSIKGLGGGRLALDRTNGHGGLDGWGPEDSCVVVAVGSVAVRPTGSQGPTALDPASPVTP